jgi:hypothetical protein
MYANANARTDWTSKAFDIDDDDSSASPFHRI